MAAGLVVFFCLVSSFLLTGVTSLKCYKCLVTRGECKNEDMALVECEQDQTHCLSMTLSVTLTSPPLSYTAKTCAKAEECFEGFYSITSTQGKYSQMKLFCCQTDGCNALPLLLPLREELKPNGFVCSGSYTRHGDSLQSAHPILCLGRETHCINFNFTMNAFGAIQGGGSFQGCTTANVCSYPDAEVRIGNLAIWSSMKECSTVPLSLNRDFLPE